MFIKSVAQTERLQIDTQISNGQDSRRRLPKKKLSCHPIQVSES